MDAYEYSRSKQTIHKVEPLQKNYADVRSSTIYLPITKGKSK